MKLPLSWLPNAIIIGCHQVLYCVLQHCTCAPFIFTNTHPRRSRVFFLLFFFLFLLLDVKSSREFVVLPTAVFQQKQIFDVACKQRYCKSETTNMWIPVHIWYNIFLSGNNGNFFSRFLLFCLQFNWNEMNFNEFPTNIIFRIAFLSFSLFLAFSIYNNTYTNTILMDERKKNDENKTIIVCCVEWMKKNCSAKETLVWELKMESNGIYFNI